MTLNWQTRIKCEQVEEIIKRDLPMAYACKQVGLTVYEFQQLRKQILSQQNSKNQRTLNV